MAADPRRPIVLACTALALLAFAANSLLCRAALGAGAIDAASFTAVRLGSGALVLAALTALRGGAKRRPTGSPTPQTVAWRTNLAGAPWTWMAAGLGPTSRKQHRRRPSLASRSDAQPSVAAAGCAGSWRGALALLAYAAPFSFAYLRLPTGVGALVLFGSVQATMLGAELAGGRRPSRRQGVGLATALAGLAGLTLPGATAPDPVALLLMTLAGIAWGAYSLLGRGAADPLATTAGNFVRSLVLLALLAPCAWTLPLHTTDEGLALAVVSGALASGVGYALWYAALPVLGATHAAIVQLLVPVLAAAAGVLLLGEVVTLRLAICGGTILGGVWFALRRR